jgi:hypothetical protein
VEIGRGTVLASRGRPTMYSWQRLQMTPPLHTLSSICSLSPELLALKAEPGSSLTEE